MNRAFSPMSNIFLQTRSSLSDLNYIFRENEEAKREVFQTVREIHEEMQRKDIGYEIAVSVLIKKMMLVLLRNDTKRKLRSVSHPDLMRLKPVLEWVERHSSERMAVEEACRQVNMSYYYFVKFFKKATGMTFTEYVNYKKIKKAERILLTEDLSISEVGEKVGMPNMAHFYKIFKKYNRCSPNEFRKNMQKWTAEAGGGPPVSSR